MQITSLNYCEDTGILEMKTDDGEEYRIEQPAYAAAVKNRVSTGGQLTDKQLDWLNQFRVALRTTNRQSLRARLTQLREELRK